MMRHVGLVTAVLVLAAVSARAQTRLFALFSGTFPCSQLGCPVGTLLDIDAGSGRVIGTARVGPGWRGSDPGVTPEGRFLVFDGHRSPGVYLDALDTASYAVTSFPVTTLTPAFGYAVHPTEPRAYFQRPDDEQVFVVDAGGVRSFPGLPARPGRLRGITADGSRLVISRYLTDEVVLVDSVTGETRGVVGNAIGLLAFNADGSEIYATGQAISGPLERRDVGTGAVLATTPFNPSSNWRLSRDPRTGHLWLAYAGVVRVLNGSTLLTMAERTFGFGTAPLQIAFDPDRPIAYLGWKPTYEADGRPAQFVALNTETLAVEAAADIHAPGLGYIHSLVLAPRPPRVEALSATVSGPVVTLAWTNAVSQAQATHVIVEAGSARGLANLARFVLPAGSSRLMVPAVPPGTYFVRVRSANGTGEGAASNEIAVTVPVSVGGPP